MKKNISNFLKKAEDDPQMAARLDIARQHYIREVMLLAEEAGVLLTMEDFLDEAVSLSDDSMESVSGGFSPSPWDIIAPLMGVSNIHVCWQGAPI